jgi:hypothetical protein
LTFGGAAKTAAAPATPADAAAQAAKTAVAPDVGVQPDGTPVGVVQPPGGGDGGDGGQGAEAARAEAAAAAKAKKLVVAASTKRAETAAKKRAAPSAVEKAKGQAGGASAGLDRQLASADPSITANAGKIRTPGDPFAFSLEIGQGVRELLADVERLQELLQVCRHAWPLFFTHGRLRVAGANVDPDVSVVPGGVWPEGPAAGEGVGGRQR